jgi:hypothetical protein
MSEARYIAKRKKGAMLNPPSGESRLKSRATEVLCRNMGGNHGQGFNEKFSHVVCGNYRSERTDRCSGAGGGAMHEGLTVPRPVAPDLCEMQR